MSVHDVNRYGALPKGHKPKNSAATPRTRPGKAFPGGKRLRKTLERLTARQKAYEPISKPSGHAQTKPGTMQA